MRIHSIASCMSTKLLINRITSNPFNEFRNVFWSSLSHLILNFFQAVKENWKSATESVGGMHHPPLTLVDLLIEQ